MSLLSNKQQSEAKRYRPVGDDLSYRELRFAGWYVRNKTKLVNVGIGALLFFCIITVGYSLVMWIGYLAVGIENDRRHAVASVAQFQNYIPLKPRFAPQQLVVGSPIRLNQSADLQDIVTEVRNPNTEWIATVKFRYAGTDTVLKETVLPTKRTLLAHLGAPGGNTRLEIIHIDWQRVSAHQVPDPVAYMAARLALPISNVVRTRYDARNIVPASVSFRVTNETAYGYWDATFYTIFYSGDAIVAVRPLILEQFEPGATEQVQFNFGPDMPEVSDIELLPTMNIFTTDVFLPVSQF